MKDYFSSLLIATVTHKYFFARFAMMLVYVWFGLPKILGVSSAEGIVTDLSEKMIPFIPSDIFLIILGIFEVALGIGFLFKKFTKIVVPIFWLHMFSTFMPLIFLADTTWSSFMVLSLEGQYIVKNIVLISLSLFILDQVLQEEKDQTQLSQG